ncbi:cobalt ABC transporter permease, CbiQ [Anopheles sinensis]|uniref:Cobalt ABC transporter permease, CbiQ n=1 Tax=Anopheles sinensis TaxID=74873 RepID=A0A084W4R2_ANOSI|nr:cobalt ABC transporter permease, CbiQ [Anopheles sinensis]
MFPPTPAWIGVDRSIDAVDEHKRVCEATRADGGMCTGSRCLVALVEEMLEREKFYFVTYGQARGLIRLGSKKGRLPPPRARDFANRTVG